MTSTTTRLRTWRLPVAAAALTLTFGLVAGCGDDDESDTSDTSAAEETTTTEEAEETTTTEEPEEETTTTEDDEDTTTTEATDTTDTTDLEADLEYTDSTWSSNATDYRDNDGERVGYKCSPSGVPGNVWGTEIYTDDSSVCTAAVHAGLITVDDGGRVVIEIAGGLDEYTASTANGITSLDYASWDGSFFFPAAGEPRIEEAGGSASAG